MKKFALPLLLAISSVAVWGFLLVISQAFVIYGQPLDPSHADFFFFLMVKYFPLLVLVALVIALPLIWIRQFYAAAVVLLPSFLLIGSIVHSVTRADIGWDSFANEEQQAFIQACASGSPQEIQRYLDAGMDVNLTGKQGLNPLLAAYLGKNMENFRYLLAKGADPNKCEKGTCRYNAGFYIANRGKSEEIAYMQVLFDSGLDPNLDNFGRRLIHLAVASKGTAHLKLLLAKGANINALNFAGQSAAHLATTIERWPNVLYLLEQGITADLEGVAASLVFQNKHYGFRKIEAHPVRQKVVALLKAKGIDFEKAYIKHDQLKQERLRKFEESIKAEQAGREQK